MKKSMREEILGGMLPEDDQQAPIVPTQVYVSAEQSPPPRTEQRAPIAEEPRSRSSHAPSPEEPKPLKQKSSERSKRLKLRVGAGAAAVAAAAGAWLAVPEHGSEAASCNTITRESVPIGFTRSHKGIKDTIRNYLPGDNPRTWEDVAERVSQDRGYIISGHRMMLANQELLPEKSASQEDELTRRGATCFKVPGPVMQGMIEIETDQTFAAAAKRFDVPAESLMSMNPQVQPNTHGRIPAGSLLRVKGSVDPELVYRDVTGKSPLELARGDVNTADRILAANPLFRNVELTGNAVIKETRLYAPLVETEYMKAQNISVEDVETAFTSTGQPMVASLTD
jgi:hypothetical protein